MKIETLVIAGLKELRISDLFMLNSLEWDVEMREELFVPRVVKETCNFPHKVMGSIDKIVWQRALLVLLGSKVAISMLSRY